MKVIVIICQVLLGLMFIVFGLNGFLHFIPMGAPPPPDSLPGKFMGSLIGSGLMPIVSALQVVGGLLVIVGRTAPLGLVILGPIVFNAVLFHLLMMGGKGIGPAALAAVLEIALIYFYRANFSAIFTASAVPVV